MHARSVGEPVSASITRHVCRSYRCLRGRFLIASTLDRSIAGTFIPIKASQLHHRRIHFQGPPETFARREALTIQEPPDARGGDGQSAACFPSRQKTSAGTPASEKRSAFSRVIIAMVSRHPRQHPRPRLSPSEGVIVIGRRASHGQVPKVDREFHVRFTARLFSQNICADDLRVED